MNRQILWVAVHFNRARSKRVLVKRSAVGQASTNEKMSTENGATGLKFAEKTYPSVAYGTQRHVGYSDWQDGCSRLNDQPSITVRAQWPLVVIFFEVSFSFSLYVCVYACMDMCHM